MKFRLSDGYCTQREIVHLFFRTVGFKKHPTTDRTDLGNQENEPG
jgi:hypothetical protein